MTPATVLLQTTPLERLEAVRQQFNRQGTGGDVVLTILGLLALVGVAIVLYRLQRRSRRPDIHHPRKLFTSLLHKLDLSPGERHLLRRMAADLKPTQPATLLLGEGVFHSQATHWLRSGRRARPDDAATVTKLAQRLFPRRHV